MGIQGVAMICLSIHGNASTITGITCVPQAAHRWLQARVIGKRNNTTVSPWLIHWWMFSRGSFIGGCFPVAHLLVDVFRGCNAYCIACYKTYTSGMLYTMLCSVLCGLLFRTLPGMQYHAI